MKRVLISLILALFSIAAFSQMYFESTSQTFIINGEEQELERQVLIVIGDGAVIIKSVEDQIPMLMQGDWDDSDGDGYEATSINVIDNSCQLGVFSIAYFDETKQWKCGLFCEDMNAYYHGKFTERVSKTTNTKGKWL